MDDLELDIKKLIVECLDLEDLTPEDIGSEEPLFGDGLSLDPIDGLELGMTLRKTYGIRIKAGNEDVRGIFSTVRSIAQFIATQKARS